jgi:hypothetical protein
MTNNQYANYRAALHAIDTLTAPCTDCPPLRDDHPHDHFNRALRDLLIDRDYAPTHTEHSFDSPDYAYATIRALLATIDDYPYSRDDLTRLLLDNSLCPLHAIDYAICFDDDDPDCTAIRTIHPSHDT